MNCSEWEERISLYAGGDLAPADAPSVEQHVAGCAGCQLLLSGLRESLGMLRETHAEPVDAAHFAAVRARVLAELRYGSARRWRFAWMSALAAAAVLLLIVLGPRPALHMPVPLPPAPVAPPIAKVVPAAVAPVKRQIRAPQASETVLVKLETDNPDVVIYWIAETKGDEK